MAPEENLCTAVREEAIATLGQALSDTFRAPRANSLRLFAEARRNNSGKVAKPVGWTSPGESGAKGAWLAALATRPARKFRPIS